MGSAHAISAAMRLGLVLSTIKLWTCCAWIARGCQRLPWTALQHALLQCHEVGLASIDSQPMLAVSRNQGIPGRSSAVHVNTAS